MKILTLIHEYPPVGGGGGLIARDLVTSLAEDGHEVRVVTAHYGDLPFVERKSNLEIVRLSSGRKEMFRAKIGAMAGYICAAIRYALFDMKDFQPDLIHVHFAVPGGAAAYVISRVKKIPYVITVHLGDIPGASPEKTKKWFQYIFPLTKPIWKKAAKIVAVSFYSKKMAEKHYSVPIEVIPNGIDMNLVHSAEIELHNEPKIVFAGRFAPQKNIIQVIDTLYKLKELPWRCTLLGDGQDRFEIENKIKQYNLEDRIKITGWVEPEFVIKTFQQSDILFLPSRSEGLPIVGIQAMACGLALVLSDAGGNPEIVKKGVNGYVAAPDDTDEFERVLRALLTDSDLLLAFRHASLSEARDYDIQRVKQQYLETFNEVLFKNKKTPA